MNARNINQEGDMLPPTLRIAVLTACLWLSGIGQAAQPVDVLSTLPADPQQTKRPQWVKAVPPYPLSLFSKAEVDLSSVRQSDNGQIIAWGRDTYVEVQQPSTDHAFQIAETQYLIDCNGGKKTFLAINTRMANGNLVRSVRMPDFAKNELEEIHASSLESARMTLACAQAEKNWPGVQYYNLHVRPKHVDETTPLTSQEKKEIDRAVSQQRESDKRNIPLAEPLLTAQSGKKVCHAMNGIDGNRSPYELCDAQGMYSHNVYSVLANGTPVIQGIDDDTTKGIDGAVDGKPMRLQCAPVNQLADNVTSKTIEGAIMVGRLSSKKVPFADELKFAIMTNVIESGRHCTLGNADGVIAKLDVVSP